MKGQHGRGTVVRIFFPMRDLFGSEARPYSRAVSRNLATLVIYPGRSTK